MSLITADMLRAFDNGDLFLTKREIIDYQKAYTKKENFCEGHNQVISDILFEYDEIIDKYYKNLFVNGSE